MNNFVQRRKMSIINVIKIYDKEQLIKFDKDNLEE